MYFVFKSLIYIFVIMCLSKEQTVNRRFTLIFSFIPQAANVANVWKTWFWFLVIRRGISYKHCLSKFAILFALEKQRRTQIITAQCVVSAQAMWKLRKGHLSQRNVCPQSHVSKEKKQESLLLERDAFPGHLSLAIGPLIL